MSETMKEIYEEIKKITKEVELREVMNEARKHILNPSEDVAKQYIEDRRNNKVK